ncbi:hypothetical protein ABW19_dt0210132 [Dactylella cylindrospora]|nr:hypothetical protein ABW19_dt0210132 [Dactylella cylindrospora]
MPRFPLQTRRFIIDYFLRGDSTLLTYFVFVLYALLTRWTLVGENLQTAYDSKYQGLFLELQKRNKYIEWVALYSAFICHSILQQIPQSPNKDNISANFDSLPIESFNSCIIQSIHFAFVAQQTIPIYKATRFLQNSLPDPIRNSNMSASRLFLQYLISFLSLIFKMIRYFTLRIAPRAAYKGLSLVHTAATHCHSLFRPESPRKNFNSREYRELVLAPDNIRIGEKVDRRNRSATSTKSGVRLDLLFLEIKDRIITNNSGINLCLDDPEMVRASSRAISKFCSSREESEKDLQRYLIEKEKIFRNLEVGENKSIRGKREHDLNISYGPKNVIANISKNVRPDYLCGYSDPVSAFEISPEMMQSIPQGLRITGLGGARPAFSSNSPKKGRRRSGSGVNASDPQDLFLPFLAVELKTGHSQGGNFSVQNQLSRCLSILAEREHEIERLAWNVSDVSAVPVIGVSGVGKIFTIWAMFRYLDVNGNANYDIRPLQEFDLAAPDHLFEFHSAMANIRNWADNERMAHFRFCIMHRLPMGIIMVLEAWKTYVGPLLIQAYLTGRDGFQKQILPVISKVVEEYKSEDSVLRRRIRIAVPSLVASVLLVLLL